ncbi:MAG: hypothetical protein ACL93V_05935 [Candidatus Electrothrix sp. YB6]
MDTTTAAAATNIAVLMEDVTPIIVLRIAETLMEGVTPMMIGMRIAAPDTSAVAATNIAALIAGVTPMMIGMNTEAMAMATNDD